MTEQGEQSPERATDYRQGCKPLCALADGYNQSPEGAKEKPSRRRIVSRTWTQNFLFASLTDLF